MNKTATGGTTESPAMGAQPRGKDETDFPEKGASESFWNRPPWDWLVSLRVGIVLLAILTVASIIGTVIDPLERAQKLVFYTFWYKGLLVILSVNMTCATLRTITRKLLPAPSTWIRRNPQYFDTTKPSASLRYKGDAGGVAATFRRHGFVTAVDGDCGYAAKGRLGRWGAPISHLGLILVLLSGFAASWVAREGYLQELEGHTTNTMQMRADSEKDVPLGFDVRIDDFETGFFPRTQIPSHYVSNITAMKGGKVLYQGPVEVNQSPVIQGWTFHQTSYQQMQGPRYKVRVESGTLAKPVELDVSPGQVRPVPGAKGVTVGLMGGSPPAWKVFRDGEVAAQGSSGGAEKSYAFQVAVEDTEAKKSLGPFDLELNKPVELGDEKGTTLVADQFEPDFVIGPDGEKGSRSDQSNNPALHVEVREGGKSVAKQWLFGREDMKSMMHAAAGKYSLDLMKVKEAEKAAGGDGEKTEASGGWKVTVVEKVPLYATVLTLSRNPLIPVIYGACGLMMLGLMVGFFTIRKEVWFRVNPKKDLLQIVASYRYSREELDGVVRGIVEELGGKRAATEGENR